MDKKSYTPYTHEERVAILVAYDASSMSLHDFCEQTGTNNRTVSNWLSDRRHQPFVAVSFPAIILQHKNAGKGKYNWIRYY